MDHELTLLDNQRARWVAAINAGKAGDFIAVLTEDAVWLPPGQQALAGKEDIRAWLAQPFESFDYDYSVTSVRIRIVGNWAIEEARFSSQLTSKTGEALPPHTGQHLLLWRKEASGSWLIERYVDRSAEFEE